MGEANQQVVPVPLPFARSYQLEALEMAIKENTIVFLETGTGKTLIAIMLLGSYSHLLKKPSPYIAVFLVPTVVLVHQQSEAVAAVYTDLKVGRYHGQKVDSWDEATWKQELTKDEVLVMTPEILRHLLSHAYLTMDQIKVLIFDECHNARRHHTYARIMTEFYHPALTSNNRQLPRIFGMTASPVKAKVSSSSAAYWNQISQLENIMNSKIFTCDVTMHVPTSTPKLKFYDEKEKPPCTSFETLKEDLHKLAEQHIALLSRESVLPSVAKSANTKLKKLRSTLIYCLTELGIWSAVKAAGAYSFDESEMDIVKAFSCDALRVFSAFMPIGLIPKDLRANMEVGYLTPKVICLVETLLEYKETKDLRCIVFVERTITAIVLHRLLNELLREATGWRAEYTAGSGSMPQSQSRIGQNRIIDDFREGKVNVIVATSMLEEGLDVQACNLVVRFDPSPTVCSFIQSRGRARMQSSDFVLILKSDDHAVIERVESYLASGKVMQQECLSHAKVPCAPLGEAMQDEPRYQVESTGALVTLSSSLSLLELYCSRLPSDSHFKPPPLYTVDKEHGRCTLELPHGCPIPTITVTGGKSLKKLAALEACKSLHQLGTLTDNLVPKIVEEEEAKPQEFGYRVDRHEHARYSPGELIGSRNKDSNTLYYCYLIELEPDFQRDEKPQGIVLAVEKMLHRDIEEYSFELNVDRGKIAVKVKLVGEMTLSPEQVALCQGFQVKLFHLLLERSLGELREGECSDLEFSYLLIPALGSCGDLYIDWGCINSALHPENASHVDVFLTCNSFSFIPRIMHQIESWLLAANLISLQGGGMQDIKLLVIKVLAAITTEECQEEHNLETLETLGDSFLKYAATQHLFKLHQGEHEGFLNRRREQMVCNATLWKLGCDRKIPGFIRSEPFDPKKWMIPGASCDLREEEVGGSKKMYSRGSRVMNTKRISDVAEALIGAFLSAAGEAAAVSFMGWLGIEVNMAPAPYTRKTVATPSKHVNISYLEGILRYNFKDPSLLVEALTHGSYVRPEIPGCYERLGFLGDAVLDYLITLHFYHNHPGLSPGMLTDLRSASVNNDCYALSAIRAGLHKVILLRSPSLRRYIDEAVSKAGDLVVTHGWESSTTLPKVLRDVIESIAGSIYVDSGHDYEKVFSCMKPLLDPLVTLETLTIHPIMELNRVCQKENYKMRDTEYYRQEGVWVALVGFETRDDVVHEETGSARDRKMATRLACKALLKSLKGDEERKLM